MRPGAPRYNTPSATWIALHRRRLENGTSPITAGLSAGYASAIARSVRFRDDAPPASVANAAVSLGSAALPDGTASTTRNADSVNVPVLSTQMVSTDASDSIALSSSASTPRRDMRTAAAA